MSPETLVAAAGLGCVLLYGLLGGADFGGGIWDLCATGPRRKEQRAAIAKAMGPVWEANHVWLIFVIILLFTAFPPAFAALSIGLFGVFHFVLVGITLRGAAFVFRGHETTDDADPWGAVFGIASVITPVLLGMAVGAVSSGHLRVHNGVVTSDGPTPWLSPIALLIGALALAICAYLAAVYLTLETRDELREDFRRRALLAGTFVVALTILALPLMRLEAPHLFAGLLHWRSAPVFAGGMLATLASGWFLWQRLFFWARAAAIAQTALLLGGWGLAQYPFLIYPDVTLQSSAAPPATLWFVIYTLPIGAALLVPSLWLLMKVFKTK